MTVQPIAAARQCQGTILREYFGLVLYNASLIGAESDPGTPGTPESGERMGTEILEVVGQRVRTARAARHWTIRELAERSGGSVRFLVQLESACGNISVK